MCDVFQFKFNSAKWDEKYTIKNKEVFRMWCVWACEWGDGACEHKNAWVVLRGTVFTDFISCNITPPVNVLSKSWWILFFSFSMSFIYLFCLNINLTFDWILSFCTRYIRSTDYVFIESLNSIILFISNFCFVFVLQESISNQSKHASISNEWTQTPVVNNRFVLKGWQ